MNLIPAYFIGLLFGLVYVFIFAGRFYLDRVENSILGLLGFVFGTIFFAFLSFFLIFFLSSSVSGTLATHAIFQLLMAVFFFISSLYFFGFLKFKKTKNTDLNSTKFKKVSSEIKVFFNFQFFWLMFSAYFISLTTFETPASVSLTFGGFYTAILFGFFSLGNE